ncbi:MarR family transcriptional regulator [Actinomycetes bacterium KLBMP 9759]
MDEQQAEALNHAIRTISMRQRAIGGWLLGKLGLHLGQEVFFLEIDANGPRTQSQLAAAAGCEAPTITNSARKLEAAGLIVRRPSPDDRRAVIVDLTEKGRALVPGLKAALHELADRTLAGLTAQEQDEVRSSLDRLAALLSREQGCGPH